MIIKRYFSEDTFNTIKSEFAFLIKLILQSGFEYDLQIRDNYFNLYYKGNSIGKISFSRETSLYKITIHYKFIDQKIKERFKPHQEGNYSTFIIPGKQLHPLFSHENLTSMAHRVKKTHFQEEIMFEQMIMTDNVNREDFIIIDRQIMDKTAKTKMDLLALAKKDKTDYQFCVIEVKLGNNSELKGEVIHQLKGYTDRIEQNFEAYRECYKINFRQKQELGLFDKNLHVNIAYGVLGIVVILGYSGLAEKSIQKMKEKEPSIRILHLKNIIDLSKSK
jgi:hypothetical protein